MATELPTGTVTFLFTDVEGSTRLLHELGTEGYAEALAEHRAIVRAALAEHGGVEVDTQGDAVFCAFSSARSAVACAREVTAALEQTPIRIRIGLHTGEALVADRHYVGMDVHRAARIGACGHGGQVVLSPSTVALLEPGEFGLADLGEHRLKDLSAPVRLHQLGQDEFPRLKTLFRTNLPIPATPFLGRETELRDLVAHTVEPGVRLLTLTGPGGTGKTRLSLQLAAEISGSYADGAWWVPLATLRDGSLVVSALASVLEVEEEPGRSLTDSVTGMLAGKRALLLLDNCEHLVEPVAELASALVATCPDVLVLATSREALAIGGEQVFPVQPLVVADAVELFFARARSAGASLDDEQRGVVTELCGRLDNLPLAVELAAARAAALPPAALLERLSSGFDVLKGPRDVDERQRTLRATIAWSYGLLDEHEQRLFRRLAVFVGGASLDAIEEICDADLEDLLSLVAKSLVRQAHVEGAEPRYFLLETIREFASFELEAEGCSDVLRARHLEWFEGLSAELRGVLMGGQGSSAAFDRLERELPNLRAAFTWGVGAAEPRERGGGGPGSLAVALVTLNMIHGRRVEAEEQIHAALALDLSPLDAATLLSRLGGSLRLRRQIGEAYEAHLAAERKLEGLSTRDEAWWETWIEVKLAQADFFYFQAELDDLRRVIGELEPAVAEHGSPTQQLELLHVIAQNRFRQERYAISQETEDLVREIHRLSAGVDHHRYAEFVLGFCLLWRGKLDEAEEYLLAALDVARAGGLAVVEARCLAYALVVCRRRGEVEAAHAVLDELEALEDLHGYAGLVAANAAWIAFREGDLDRADSLGKTALEDWSRDRRGGTTVFQWTARFPLLEIALGQGRLDDALEHARAMLDESQQPLPDALAEALARAVECGDGESLARALELARTLGYA